MSANLNTTSYRRGISDIVLTRKNDIITTSYRCHAWNDVEIRLKSCCNCVEITLKLWRWNIFHMKPFFNVVSTSVCYFSTLFQRWNNIVVPAGNLTLLTILIFTHLKLCLFNAIHNFKWLKITNISNLLNLRTNISKSLNFNPLPAKLFNPFWPEFTIVIFIHCKPRIAVAILGL